MNWNEHHTKLKATLAQLIPVETNSRQYVEMAGIPLGNISFSSSANTNWYQIIKEAQKQGKLLALIDAVLMDYPHAELTQIKAALAPDTTGSGDTPTSGGADPKAELKQKVLDLIAKGKVKNALLSLSQGAAFFDEEEQLLLINLQARLARLKNQEMGGTISDENLGIEINKISMSVMTLVGQI